MTIAKILQSAEKKLTNSDSPRLDAEVLLAYRLNNSREFLLTHPENNIPWLKLFKFKMLIRRRSKGEPVAHLTGVKEFFNLDFLVNKNVLTPRPETETLVEETIKLNRKSLATIIEIGTGSGCVAIALAKHLPHAKIFAIDISNRALKVAGYNAKKHNVMDRIKFLKGNLLEPIINYSLPATRYALPNVLVANLPYGPTDEYNQLILADKSPLAYEPRIAITGGGDGLDLFRQLFTQIYSLQHKPKVILLEMHPPRAQDTLELVNKTLKPKKTTVKKDLSGLDRVLIIEL
jgi:release factor glutamine methyltransferase